jgi:hypothetical protein
MDDAAVYSVVGPLIERGLVATAAPLDWEFLWTAQNLTEYEQIWQDREVLYEYLYTDDEHWRRALEAQRALAQISILRAIRIVDLLVAALAEAHRLTVIHYDSDFEIASQVMNFSHQWVVPRGTV